METQENAPTQKAFRLNLDSLKYGSFAEIGAGQEVARSFFRAGGASGTVAKTISAYDMVLSDTLYGQTDQYVSRARLEAMLNREYRILLENLTDRRDPKTTFFAFSDTVATRSYSRKKDGHGWMGIRFQHQPKSEPSEVILHVHLFDLDPVREQEALGILGVNLIFGVFFQRERIEDLMGSLLDNLSRDRLEIDMIRFSGPGFAGIDNRLMSLQLVEQDLTDATMFTAAGEVVQPAEVLYKKPVLVVRGSFRPITNIVLDMIQRSQALCRERPNLAMGELKVVMEITLRNLMENELIDHGDFLARADLLGSLGYSVMVSRLGPYHSFVSHLRDYTKAPILIPLGIPALMELLDEKYYGDLPGGILESLGLLFAGDVQLYAYPHKHPKSGIITPDNLEIPRHLQHLYRHLLENKLIVPISGVEESKLHILPREILSSIREGDSSWESMVPPPVAEAIKRNGYFGYRG